MLKVKATGFEELSKSIKKLTGKIKNQTKPYAESKIIMLKDVHQHFKYKQGEDKKWDKLTRVTLLRRRKKGKGAKILQDSGRGRMSITAISGMKFAAIGTNLDYMIEHQEGKGKLPKRDFLWISKGAQNSVEKRFILWNKV